MKKIIIFFHFLLNTVFLIAQEKVESNTLAEQQLESEIEREDVAAEDDSYWQQMEYYKNHPLNINSASEDELRLFKIINDRQIAALLIYRDLFGALIDIYELQAIPGWDVQLIRKLLPYITITIKINSVETIKQRLRNGDYHLLLRFVRSWDKTKEEPVNRNYLGGLSSLQFRYKYQYKNLLQWGITGDKDSGEPFFSNKQKNGFDFYSAHLFIQKINKIKAIALGDYTVNLGQGLLQWQNLAFKKSSAVLNIKRQGSVLRPYSSAGEYNFHRGAGITLGNKKWDITIFTSLRKLSANRLIDSIQNTFFVSSLQTSGYHRSVAELEDKNSLQMLAFGGSIQYHWVTGHLGINSINYDFSLPIIKEAAPYNLYSLNGRSLNNYSVDFGQTIKNIHLFGEVAVDNKMNTAIVTGLLASIDPTVDIAFLYRSINKVYQSLFSNAFTERSSPSNENGLYGGISLMPFFGLRFDAYVDLYRNPWLTANINAPATGREYLFQFTYTPSKTLEIYGRFRNGTRLINESDPVMRLSNIIETEKKQWRFQVSYSADKKWTLRTRVELINFNKEENGFLGYIDVFYKPLNGLFKANARVQYFETDGYSGRIYAYENDLLYNYSVPAFYNKGVRWYLNGEFNIKKNNHLNQNLNMSLAFKIGQTIEPDLKTFVLAADPDSKRSNTMIKVQIFLGWKKNNN